MSTGSVLLGIALLTAVVLFLARPFLKRPARELRMTRRQNLLIQKEVFLDQIRSLDFDHDTGKVPDQVYQKQRAYLLAEATNVLRELDEADFRSGQISAVPARTAGDVDAQIEAVIARFRQSPAPAGAENGKRAFCTQCGRPIDPGDRFCAHCGHELITKQPA